MARSESDIQRVRELIPELNLISDSDLRDRVANAWVKAWRDSSFADLADIPGAGTGEEYKEYEACSQVAHMRAVALMVEGMIDSLSLIHPDLQINRDVAIAGAIAHDLGKAFESDPENIRRWDDGKGSGFPAVRHPVYGVHIALEAGLPEEVVHIVGAHSREGQFVRRSLENVLVHYADYCYWDFIKVTRGNWDLEC